MDDIQLCKDIMNLKKELQSLVAIPGNGSLQPNIRKMVGMGSGTHLCPNSQKSAPKAEFHLFLLVLFLPVFLPIFSLLVSKFLFMLYFPAPWAATCKYH